MFSTLQKPRVFDLRCEKSFYSKNQRCVIFMNAGFICVKICSKLRADKVTMVYWLVGVGALSIWFRHLFFFSSGFISISGMFYFYFVYIYSHQI